MRDQEEIRRPGEWHKQARRGISGPRRDVLVRAAYVSIMGAKIKYVVSTHKIPANLLPCSRDLVGRGKHDKDSGLC
jgi:hypothetical protein